jgi:eukaryotic-like serine/threonine-protein kinase
MIADANDPRLDELLLRWEELHDQGQSLSADELCSTCPELAGELARRIALLRKMDPLLGDTTTDPAGPTPATPAGGSSRTSATARADFHELRFHAAGALGEVFMARNVELNREVALKFLKPERSKDPDSLRRFLQEAEVTGRLEHPGVVPIYALGTDGSGAPCYAMRFIRGETLQEPIGVFHAADETGRDPSERSLALRDLLNRFVSVCNTIGYAHSRGILHRDLKPRNVMLGKYDETLVVDWGLAKPFDRDEAARSVGEETLTPSSGSDSGSDTPTVGAVGTPAYMSPEQAEAKWEMVGPASDIFGLGAILYTILTGRPPYQGRTIGEVLERVKRCEFPAPRRIKPGVSRALEAVCLKAMAPKPEDRYATAIELAADVRRWLADEPVAAYSDPITSKLSRWARRHKSAVAATLVALSISAVVLSLAAISQARINDLLTRANREAGDRLIGLELARVDSLWRRDPRQALDILMDSKILPESERNFYWWHLRGLCERLSESRLTLSGHTGIVAAVAFRPDGKMLASADVRRSEQSAQNAIRLWDPTSGKLLRILDDHTASKLVFSADGGRLAAAMGESVAIWDTKTFARILQFPAVESPRGVLDVALSPDGALLATAGQDRWVRIWNSTDGRLVRGVQLVGWMPTSVDFSPDGRVVLADDSTGPGQGGFSLWDAKTGRQLRRIPALGMTIYDARFSPDGSLIVASGEEIRGWKADTGEEVFALRGIHGVATNFAFRPDGSAIAFPDIAFPVDDVAVGRVNNAIHIYDLKSRREVLSYPGHAGIIPSLAYSPDGRSLASAGGDEVVRLWDTSVDQEMLTLNAVNGGMVSDLAFGQGGTTVTALSQPTFFASSIQVWDAIHGRELAAIQAKSGGRLITMALSPDGHTVATGGDDGLIRVWDLKTQAERRTLAGHSGWVQHLAYSPDGKILASTQTYVDVSQFGGSRPSNLVVAETQEVHLWDPATGQPLGRLPVPPMPTRENKSLVIGFSHDGIFLVGVYPNGVIAFWDMRGRSLARTLVVADLKGSGFALSPDGSRFVTVGERNSVTIRDSSSGRKVRTLRGHEGPVRALAFSPDGKTLATASVDGTVKLWNPDFEQERLTLRGHSGAVYAIAFSPDGAVLASAGSDGTIRLWQGQAPGRPAPLRTAP